MRKTLRMKLVLFIFLILFFSAILTGIFGFIFYQLVQVFPGLIRPRMPFLAWVIMALFVSTMIGTALSFRFSETILKPVQNLINAMKEVANGNYNVQVSEPSAKEMELHRLIVSFNKMATELGNVELLKSDFINYFSHEFKTPIVSIRGFAKQLGEGDLSDEERKEYADIIYKESERLVKLSSNVLLLSKLEYQTIVSDKKAIQLDEQIRHCILLLQEEWERKNLNLEIDLSAAEYFGNEEMLSQVWINLLGNAIQYSKENGTIKISCTHEVGRIKVRIADDGPGMSDEIQNHIFDKFYQGDPSRKNQGNGLGLAIVKRILDLCEAKIIVKSKDSEGAVFVVYLPETSWKVKTTLDPLYFSVQKY